MHFSVPFLILLFFILFAGISAGETEETDEEKGRVPTFATQQPPPTLVHVTSVRRRNLLLTQLLSVDWAVSLIKAEEAATDNMASRR